jgi:hypothetical protein
LLCTTSEALQNARKISCDYNGVAGGDGRLKGNITIKGKAAFPPGRRVLMWSVLARRSDTTWKELVGRYRETTLGQLSGGKDGKIVLRPPTDTIRSRDRAITILELKLDPIRA